MLLFTVKLTIFIINILIVLFNGVCMPVNNLSFTKVDRRSDRIKRHIRLSVEYGFHDYSTAFQCMDVKLDECKLHCKNQEADEAECEDPWPPADSLNCFCYKKDKLIDGKVLHLNLTDELYMSPEKLAELLT